VTNLPTRDPRRTTARKALRVLVVSSRYPPDHEGGYEIGCRDVVDALIERGHEVEVLAGATGAAGDAARHIRRELAPAAIAGRMPQPVWIARMFARDLTNRRTFERTCRRFRPDVAYLWQLYPISASLAFAAQRLGLPVCYYVFDYWLARWREHPWPALWLGRAARPMGRLARGALRPLAQALRLVPEGELDLSRAQFASEHLRRATAQAGSGIDAAPTIPFGVDPRRFPYRQEPRPARRLLFVGRLTPEKGVDTLLGAARLLAAATDRDRLEVNIVGGPLDGVHAERLRNAAATIGPAVTVSFTGRVDRERLPAVYAGHDILVFPSVWDEPFGITILEAMSCGLAVVATGTGGSGEIVRDGINALTFPPGDEQALAARIERLRGEPRLLEELRHRGRVAVEETFALERTVDRIEDALRDAAAQRGRRWDG